MLDKQLAEEIVAQVESAILELNRSFVILESTRGTQLYENMRRAIGLAIGNIDLVLNEEIFEIYPELDRTDHKTNPDRIKM